MAESETHKSARRFERNQVRNAMLRAHQVGVSWGSLRDLIDSLEGAAQAEPSRRDTDTDTDTDAGRSA